MEDFVLEGLKELYRQERKKLEELAAKETEKALCDMGLELLKDIEHPADNPALAKAAEEKYREYFERRKKARLIASDKYALQKIFFSKIEKKLAEQYGLIPEIDPQGDILFKKKEGD